MGRMARKSLADPYRLIVMADPDPEHRRSELPNCHWCSFKSGETCNSPANEIFTRANHPEMQRRYAYICDVHPSCQSFRPTVLTRLFRVLGLRKPVWSLQLPRGACPCCAREKCDCGAGRP